MNLISLICLLLFGFSTGFSITKAKRHLIDTYDLEDPEDVYQVEEDKKTLRLSHPKPAKPTLREIVYYHVIETPYGGESVEGNTESAEENCSNSEEEDDLVKTENGSNSEEDDLVKTENGSNFEEEDDLLETERPFTNSHGLPFFLDESEETDSSEEEVTTEIMEIYSDEENDEQEQEDEGSTETISSNKAPAESSTKTNEIRTTQTPTGLNTKLNNSRTTTTISTPTRENKTIESDPSRTEKKDIKEGSVVSSTVAAEVETTTPFTEIKSEEKKDEVVEEKINSRSALFKQAREKYQSKLGKKRQQRRRRSLKASDIPEAPKLQPLNLNSLPEYARKLISTPAPEIATGNGISEEAFSFNEEEFRNELKKQIEASMATMKPVLLENYNTEGDEEEKPEESLGQTVDREVKLDYKKTRPKTFGMNLTMDRGYVWNDLLGDPGMFIEVGDANESHDTEEQKVITEIPVEVPTSTHFSIESKPIYMNNPNFGETKDKENSEDIFVEIKESNHKDVKGVSSEKESIDHGKKPKEILNVKEEKIVTENYQSITETGSNISDIDTDIGNDIGVTKSTTDTIKDTASITESTIICKTNTEQEKFPEKENEKDSKADGIRKNKKNTINEEVTRALNEISKSEILQELLKSEKFWKWLRDWTSTYVEFLMKHIKNMVHDETGRQMKTYTANLRKQIQKEIEEALKFKEQSAIHYNDPDAKQKTREDTLQTQKEKPKKKDKGRDSNHNEDSKNNESHNGTDDIDITVRNDKILIDGKELPLTHKSNFKDSDDLLKRRKDKDKEDIKYQGSNTQHLALESNNVTKNNEKQTPINVTAQNIYGSSVGSDKVTNIFVFFPRDKENVNEIKPLENDNNENIYLIDKRKEDGAIDLVGQKEELIINTEANKEVTKISTVEDQGSNDKKVHKVENNNVYAAQKEPTEKPDMAIKQDNTEEHNTEENGYSSTERSKVTTTITESNTFAKPTSETNEINTELQISSTTEQNFNQESTGVTTEHIEEITSPGSVTKETTEYEENNSTTESIPKENTEQSIITESNTFAKPTSETNEINIELQISSTTESNFNQESTGVTTEHIKEITSPGSVTEETTEDEENKSTADSIPKENTEQSSETPLKINTTEQAIENSSKFTTTE